MCNHRIDTIICNHRINTFPNGTQSSKYVLQYAKSHLWTEVMSNSKKFKCIGSSLKAVIVSRNFLKNQNSLLKEFQVNPKAFLGLVLPNQYCSIIMNHISGS